MVEEVARLLSQARGAYQREQYQVALAYFQQACQVDAHSPEALLGMGEVSSFLGFRDQAVGAFLSLADLYLRAAMLEVAAEVIERIIDLDPANPVALRFQRYIAARLRPGPEVSQVTALERPNPLPRNMPERLLREVDSSDLERWDRADSTAPTNVQSHDNELDELIGDLATPTPATAPRNIAYAETQLARTPTPVSTPAATPTPPRSRYSVTLTGAESETEVLATPIENDFEVVTRSFEAAEITALDPEPVDKPSVIFDFGDDEEEGGSVTDLSEPDPPQAPDVGIDRASERSADDVSTVVAGDLPRLLARRTDPRFRISSEETAAREEDTGGRLYEIVDEPVTDIEPLTFVEPATTYAADDSVEIVIEDAGDEDAGETETETEGEDEEDDDEDDEATETEDPFSATTAVGGDLQRLLARRTDPAFVADTEVSPVSPTMLAAIGTGAHKPVSSWEANTEAAVMAENFRDRPALSIDAGTEELDLSDFPSYEEGDAEIRATATIALEDADAAAALDELGPISPLLGQLGAEGRAGLLETSEVLKCFAGHVVCREGETGNELFLLLSGQAAVERTPPGSTLPQRIASLSPGAFFGEGSVLADAPRASTVRVIEDALLLEVERSVLQALVKKQPQLLTILTRFLRARLVSAMMMTSPMFLRLDMRERAALAPLLHVHKLNPGQQVVRRGQLLTGYCTVMAGELQRTALADGTGKQVSGSLQVGDSFGTSCLDARPAVESIGAITGCWLVRLPTENLRQLCESHPGMLEALRAADVLS
jgi:CRP-like cAMP-binding protein/tetratricopeptide (TPR) repeat protein